jgi:hypothetical protein
MFNGIDADGNGTVGFNEFLTKMTIRSCREGTLFGTRVDHVLLRKAVAEGFSVHLVKLLLEAFSESCMIQDSDGMVPLHHACKKQTADWVNVASLILKESPKSATMKDNNGITPSQLLKEAASRKDDEGKLLLHHQATRPKDLRRIL